MLQQLFKNFASFLLYSNVFIAFSAVAMSLETLVLAGEDPGLWTLQGEVFAATLCIYAMHRLVSLGRLREDLVNQRFRAIRSLRRLIWVVLGLSIIAAAILLYWLQPATQLALVLPATLSLGYVLPFWKNKRLRDFHFLKIFLIAAVWAYVTVLLPLLELGRVVDYQILLLFSERAIFIFAITLPFDIRDWEIEQANGVRTIPSWIGVNATVYLALACLAFWLVLCFWLYPLKMAFLLSGIAVITGLLIWGSRKPRPDYYFTGFLDGMMLLQGLAVVLSSK